MTSVGRSKPTLQAAAPAQRYKASLPPAVQMFTILLIELDACPVSIRATFLVQSGSISNHESQESLARAWLYSTFTVRRVRYEGVYSNRCEAAKRLANSHASICETPAIDDLILSDKGVDDDRTGKPAEQEEPCVDQPGFALWIPKMKSFTQLLPFLASLAAASPIDLTKSGLHELFVRQDIQTPINASLPNVTIFATGGTIASQGSSNTQTTGYSVGLGVQQLVDAVPELLNISNIAGYQISNVGSGSINETISLKLARMINEELAKPEISGVIVTHGTDTLEETAFFLESTARHRALRRRTPQPLPTVVLAGSPAGQNRGTMIVLNDRIGSAFYTTKNNANSLDTFFSTEAGQLGTFINQVPYFFFAPSEPVGRVVFDVSNATSLAQVDILYAHQDMDTALFNASAAAGAEGIVYAGVGAGGMSSKANIAAEELYNATGIPIVASHRSADGMVPPASDDDFTISSGFYNPQKARILLQLGLTVGWSREEIAAAFAKSLPMP
ncbi:hypothetical protein OPT61_g1759 [Boeremia exigua]|uniref:Uncharacterized protein n=1 Tax=Boeremia exigua TaxID=749465 RepID=A0ACC2INY4_9PLEO|nr:hypothetical protein OPT61_g1759 [Boeremia exigua]